MVQLITASDYDGVAQAMKGANPDWILLDKEKVKELLKSSWGDSQGYPYYGKYFILPYELINRRFASTRTNFMVTYLIVQGRKKAQTFTLVAPSRDRVDLRLQRMIDKETEWV